MIRYVRATNLKLLEEQVNDMIDQGYEAFLPLVVRGESYIQPMRSIETFIGVRNSVGEMFEIGDEITTTTFPVDTMVWP